MLDFEIFVAGDENTREPEEVARRDARLWTEQIASALRHEDRNEREAVFLVWTRARCNEGTTPGSWLMRGWQILGSCSLLGGLVIGFIVAGGALNYTGGRPVNVPVFLAITVAIQWLMQLWTLFVVLWMRLRGVSNRMLVKWSERLGLWFAGITDHLSVKRRMELRAKLTVLRKLAGRNLELRAGPGCGARGTGF